MLALFLAAAALTPAAPAQAPAPAADIDFTGKTTADPKMIWDAMQEVARFSAWRLKCDRITAVKASIQPESWQPADVNFRIGPSGARYERWDVAQCDRVVAFLVAFWGPDGKKEFQVAHPFPGEPEAKPRP